MHSAAKTHLVLGQRQPANTNLNLAAGALNNVCVTVAFFFFFGYFLLLVAAFKIHLAQKSEEHERGMTPLK